MPGFDFGQTAPLFEKFFDSDRMDIGRRVKTQDPDGFWIETNPEEPLYLDVPCHIAFNTADNPQATGDTPPIVMSIAIHCPLHVDLQNGDYVYAHKCDPQGNVIETYSGFISFRTVSQARQSVQMAMRKGL